MHIPATITEMIQILMQDYGFPEEVLARHFRLTAEQLEQLLSGDPDGLPGIPPSAIGRSPGSAGSISASVKVGSRSSPAIWRCSSPITDSAGRR